MKDLDKVSKKDSLVFFVLPSHIHPLCMQCDFENFAWGNFYHSIKREKLSPYFLHDLMRSNQRNETQIQDAKTSQKDLLFGGASML